MTPGEVLADLNVAEFIKQLALGIVEAQRELDDNSIAQAIKLANTTLPGSSRSLLELGLSPPFYHFQYADIEVSLHLKMVVGESFDIGGSLTAGYDSNTTTTNTGTATITVTTGRARPAVAVLTLVGPTLATLTVGATTLALVNGTATAPDVSIAPASVRLTAEGLVQILKQTVPTDAVIEINRATSQCMDPTPILPSTNDPDVFTCKPGSIVINELGEKEAVAWVSVTDLGGKVTLIGEDATWTSQGTTVATAVEATAEIDALLNHDATLIVNNGEAVAYPLFAFDSFALGSGYYPALDKLADWLLTNNVTFTLEGHTDVVGNTTYNQTLSLQRANAVRTYLINKGIAPGRINVVGKGESEPIPGAPDSANRRVEILFPAPTTNVIEIVGPMGGEWDANPTFTLAGAGTTLAKQNGKTLVLQPESYVEVNGCYFYVNALPTSPKTPNVVFSAGASAKEAAVNLAAAILANPTLVDEADAWVDPVGSNHVLLYSRNTSAEIVIETLEAGAAANLTKLEVTGALRKDAGFSGGEDASYVSDGNSVTLGGTSFTCRFPAPPGPNEFARGSSDADTATNLAAAITGVPPYTTSVAGAVVTVTGPAATAIATNNPGAFKLSGTKLGGAPAVTTNKTVALGATFDARYSKQFSLEVEGNSRIAARLVAIPAPVEMLAEIKKYLT